VINNDGDMIKNEWCLITKKIASNNDTCCKLEPDREEWFHQPITTTMLELITSVTERPTYAQAYWVDRFPMLRTTPPAMANSTEGQLSFNTKTIRNFRISALG